MPLSLCVYNRRSNLGASDDNEEVKANARERTRYLVWVGLSHGTVGRGCVAGVAFLQYLVT